MGLTEDDGKAACCVVVGKGGGVKIFTSLRGIWGGWGYKWGYKSGVTFSQKWGYKIGFWRGMIERG